jgi:hypothetical protein
VHGGKALYLMVRILIAAVWVNWWTFHTTSLVIEKQLVPPPIDHVAQLADATKW